jgi:hypothetical protein
VLPMGPKVLPPIPVPLKPPVPTPGLKVPVPVPVPVVAPPAVVVPAVPVPAPALHASTLLLTDIQFNLLPWTCALHQHSPRLHRQDRQCNPVWMHAWFQERNRQTNSKEGTASIFREGASATVIVWFSSLFMIRSISVEWKLQNELSRHSVCD